MSATLKQFHVHGMAELDDENGERFQVRVQEVAPTVAVAAGAAAPAPIFVGFVVPLDFPIGDAATMRADGVKRGARVTLSLAVVADKA